MFSSIRKLTALVLAAMFMCMMVPIQAETADLDVEVVFGTVNNDTYENPYLGLGCTLEGWHYYSDEELEGVNQRTKDALSDELDDLVDQNIGIMMAEQPDGMRNVNIQLQNVKNYVSIYEMMGTHEVAVNSLSGFQTTLEAANFTDIQLEVAEQTIGDKTFTCILGQYKIKGVQIYFRQIWDVRDIYLVTVTATTVLEDKTEEVFSKFFLK